MMNFPGVIAGDPDVLSRIVAPHVDGHAPGVMGAALDAYVAAGHLDRPRGLHGRGGAARSAGAGCGC